MPLKRFTIILFSVGKRTKTLTVEKRFIRKVFNRGVYYYRKGKRRH